MPTRSDSKVVMYLSDGATLTRVNLGKILARTVNTNVSGVARFYMTDDGTATGLPIFTSVYGWSDSVVTALPAISRVTNDANMPLYVDVTVTQQVPQGLFIALLGLSVIVGVNTTAVTGVPVKLTVFGS